MAGSIFVTLGADVFFIGPDYRAEILPALLKTAGGFYLASQIEQVRAALADEFPALLVDQDEIDLTALEEFYFAPCELGKPFAETVEILQRLTIEPDLIDSGLALAYYQAGEFYYGKFLTEDAHHFEQALDTSYLYAPGLAVVAGLLAMGVDLTAPLSRYWKDELAELGYTFQPEDNQGSLIDWPIDEPLPIKAVAV